MLDSRDRRTAVCQSLTGYLQSLRPKLKTLFRGACSAMVTTCAPCFLRVSATTSNSGPLPAVTTRRPATGQPFLIKACKPPGPIIPGSVQPGNGRNSSQAPVARIKRLHRISTWPVSFSARSAHGLGKQITEARSISVVPDLWNLSNHRFATAEVGRICCPRQIWPPSQGVSSSRATREPLSAAVQAAARPAGPAPTTTTSNSKARSDIRLNLHAIRTHGQATTTVLLTIDGYSTFHANPHTAERSARGPQNRTAESRQARLSDCGGYHGAGLDANACPVHLYLDILIHRYPLRRQSAWERKVPVEFRTSDSAADPLAAAPCQVTS